MKRKLKTMFIPLALVVLTFLYWKTRAFDFERHEAIEENLRSIKNADAVLNESILKSRFGLLRTYDPLVLWAGTVATGFAALKQGSVAIYGTGDAGIDGAMDEYEAMFRERERLVELYKTSSSILNNSLRYFPVTTERLIVRTAKGSNLRDRLVELYRLVLLFAITTSEKHREAVLLGIGRFEYMAVPEEFQDDLEIVLRHARNILVQNGKVDRLLAEVIRLPVSDLGDRMFAAYSGSSANMLRETDIYRLLLYVFCIVLLLYIVLVGAKLHFSAKALRGANRRLSRLNVAFERFVPHEFLAFLRRDSIADVKLGDHVERDMTVLFSDIRSFSTMSEGMTPEQNFHFINSYLSEMGPVVREHGGFIDKYIGDAIMALFDGGPDAAVRAAIAMLLKLNEYNRKLAGSESNARSLEIGIGIHSGSMMLGTVGERHRMEGTVISDAVNLASRIEGMNKLYGTNLLVSDTTYGALSHPSRYDVRVLDRVRVQGKGNAVTVHDIYNADPPDVSEGKRKTAHIYERGMELYFNNEFQKAMDLFREVLKIHPDDRASKVHVEQCKQLLSGASHLTWDGAFRLEVK